MSKDERTSNVQRNLKTLLSQFGSVAEFCRTVGVNRQQFNKYLAGTHAPSRGTMLNIGSFFKLSADDFTLSRHEFEIRLQGKPGDAPALPDSAHFRQLLGFAQASAPSLKPFLGTYFRYHLSSIYRGKVVRAVTVIRASGSLVEYVTAERFPLQSGEGKGSYSFLYAGVCYLMGNRFFMFDYERKQKNEMTSAILMPEYRTPMKYMFGLLMGVASTAFGQPFASPVVLEKRSDAAAIRKSSLRMATVLERDDPAIAPNIAQYFLKDEHRLMFGGK